MKYRKFGKLDFKVSAFGFGCMRLPVIDNNNACINEPEATKMLHYAIDQGVNFVDTAYPYHGEKSEVFVGRALKYGYRKKVKLTTKLPTYKVEVSEDFDKILNHQLKKLQTDHVDFYLLHGLNKMRWHKIYDMNVRQWAERAIADGRIGHLGFSFHDKYPVFKEIIDAYDQWALCVIQYNFMNEDVQAGTKGLKYAAERGLAVGIMEPLLGGLLANPPDKVQRIWNDAKKNPIDLALRWLWNKPEISVVLSGVNTMAQVIKNVGIAEMSGIDTLTQDELDIITQVRNKYKEFSPILCTKCGYCMPCPNGIDIVRNIELYNEGMIHNRLEMSKVFYNALPKEECAGACILCSECEAKCPQDIKISEWMPHVHEALKTIIPFLHVQ